MVDGPWKVVGDNAQAEAWAREWSMMTINSRHIQQKYHIVKHMVKQRWFTALWQAGPVNPADIGTKPIDGTTGNRLIPQARGAAPLQHLPDPVGVLRRSGVDSLVIEEIYGTGTSVQVRDND